MKVLVAGATGAIGQPLLKILKSQSHEIVGITKSPHKTDIILQLGGEPIVLDVLDKVAVMHADENIKPDVIVNMLTHLPTEYTPEAMKDAAPIDAKLRIEGGKNLLEAAEIYGVKRIILQSSAFWYEEGKGYADENTPFALKASPGVAAGSELYKTLETNLFASKKVEGVALRFGFFYGPGTWFHPKGNMADQIKNHTFPLIGNGEGIWNFVEIEDAAWSIAAALNCEPGTYNVVNDEPVSLLEWVSAFTTFEDAGQPSWLSEEEATKKRGADAVYYATKLRAAANDKSKKILGFTPQAMPEWLISYK